MLALKVFFNQMAENAYAPIDELDYTGQGKNVKGLGSMQAEILAKVWDERLKHDPTQLEDQQILKDQLINGLREWTLEIQDSKYDLDQSEVDMKKAMSKRTVKPEFFKAGWLENLLGIGEKKQNEAKTVQKESIAGAGAPQPAYKERLKRLKELLEEGLISEEEYKGRKEEILKEI